MARTSRKAPAPTPGNTFSRDAYLAALEPPRFDLGGGRVAVGRILSADEWFAYEDRLMLAAQDQLTTQGLRALMVEMTDRTFAPLSNGRRWPFRRETKISTLLLQLPIAARNAQFESFILAQAEAQKGTTLRAMAGATDGTPS